MNGDGYESRVANLEIKQAVLEQKFETTNQMLTTHMRDNKELIQTLNESIKSLSDANDKLRQTLLMFQWIALGCGMTILAVKYGFFEILKAMLT